MDCKNLDVLHTCLQYLLELVVENLNFVLLTLAQMQKKARDFFSSSEEVLSFAGWVVSVAEQSVLVLHLGFPELVGIAPKCCYVNRLKDMDWYIMV